MGIPLPPPEQADRAAEQSHEGGLTIPRHLWSGPVSEARAEAWTPRLPWFGKLIAALAVVGLFAGFFSAQASTHGHRTASGWLLGLAVCAVVTGFIGMAVHLVVDFRYDRGDIGGDSR